MKKSDIMLLIEQFYKDLYPENFSTKNPDDTHILIPRRDLKNNLWKYLNEHDKR